MARPRQAEAMVRSNLVVLRPDDEAVRVQGQSLGYPGSLASVPIVAQRLPGGGYQKHSTYMGVIHTGNSNGHIMTGNGTSWLS